MLLAVDIGNTNIAVGCSENNKIIFVERISTNKYATALEYSVLLKNILEFHNIRSKNIDGVVSSVVPQITETVCKAVEKLSGGKVLEVRPEIINLRTKLENPSQTGVDLLSAASAVINEYPLPAVVIDMGTAITITVINREGEFMGGMIMPGFQISLDSLVQNTSLPKISIGKPEELIAKSTPECMKSGIIYGTASCIDGILERIQDETGEKSTVIASGGLAEFIVPYCRHKILVDSELVLKGLVIIYNNNKKILP